MNHKNDFYDPQVDKWNNCTFSCLKKILLLKDTGSIVKYFYSWIYSFMLLAHKFSDYDCSFIFGGFNKIWRWDIWNFLKSFLNKPKWEWPILLLKLTANLLNDNLNHNLK